MSAIAKIEQDAPRGIVRSDTVSDMQWWSVAKEQAKALVSTGFLPGTINSPEKALAVMLKGRELGVPSMYALGNIHIVEGKPTCSAELMLALVKRDHGDVIRVKHSDNERCTVEWKQWGEVSSYTFTMQDARLQGVDNKQTWKKYPAAMLRARCISAVCRMAFPESIAGMYVPDEMGANVTVRADGEVVIEAESPPPPVNIRERLAAQKHEPAPEPQNDAPSDVEIIDESTGEIISDGRDLMDANREKEVVAETEDERKRPMKFMFASARNKLSEEQMHVVSRAAYGATSHKELDAAQLDVLGACYAHLPFSHINALVEICDVMANGPLTEEGLKIVADEIKQQQFEKPVAEVLRLAYLRAMKEVVK